MNRIAVIVIGSNSTRSLCCDETPALSHPLRGRVETRLLLHLNKENPMLTDEAIALLAGGVSQLYEQIQHEFSVYKQQGKIILPPKMSREQRLGEL